MSKYSQVIDTILDELDDSSMKSTSLSSSWNSINSGSSCELSSSSSTSIIGLLEDTKEVLCVDEGGNEDYCGMAPSPHQPQSTSSRPSPLSYTGILYSLCGKCNCASRVLHRICSVITGKESYKRLQRKHTTSDMSEDLLCIVQTQSATESSSYSQYKHPKLALSDIVGHEIKPRSYHDYLFVPWNTDGYTLQVTDAVRQQDIATLRELHAAGANLQCTNRFGESLVHTAARRREDSSSSSSLAVLQFLHQECQVSLQVACDSGRTPLHDACWTSQPCFATIWYILEHHPEFLYMADQRGYTPLDYVPADAFGLWHGFLQEYELQVVPLLSLGSKNEKYEV